MSDTMINLPSQWQYSLAAGTMTNQYGYCDYTTPLPSMTAFNYASAPVFTPTSGEQLCAIYVYCVRCVASCVAACSLIRMVSGRSEQPLTSQFTGAIPDAASMRSPLSQLPPNLANEHVVLTSPVPELCTPFRTPAASTAASAPRSASQSEPIPGQEAACFFQPSVISVRPEPRTGMNLVCIGGPKEKIDGKNNPAYKRSQISMDLEAFSGLNKGPIQLLCGQCVLTRPTGSTWLTVNCRALSSGALHSPVCPFCKINVRTSASSCVSQLKAALAESENTASKLEKQLAEKEATINELRTDLDPWHANLERCLQMDAVLIDLHAWHRPS